MTGPRCVGAPSQLIEERMGGADAFKAAVADCCRYGRYTPAHSILGAMRLPAVTTNYDQLYEAAAESAATRETERVMRLPWDAAKLARAPDATRRLLKMHGCVSDEQSQSHSLADCTRIARDARLRERDRATPTDAQIAVPSARSHAPLESCCIVCAVAAGERPALDRAHAAGLHAVRGRAARPQRASHS